MDRLQDAFGRNFPYLRLSVTDVCNFRCVYCLPQGYKKPAGHDHPLSVIEIQRLAQAFSELGMWKIRLTGGEPTVRRDLLEIIRALSEIPEIRRIALSTNGYRLSELAKELLGAGVRAINVSIDSLDPARFARITGFDRLDEILEGVDRALEVGFESVKINAVLLKDTDESEVQSFADWIRARPVTVRFIELMPTTQTADFFEQRHVSSTRLRNKLEEWGWMQRARVEGDGPAIEYTHPQFKGRFGFIAPYSPDFCRSCNRLRVTSQGALRLCLFADGNYSLRPFLQSDGQKEELKSELHRLLGKKEVSHFLTEGRYGNNRTFSAIGG